MTLVDSDVLVAHLRGYAAARDWLLAERRRGGLSVSAVTVAAVLGGMRSGECHEVRALLSALECRPVTRTVAELAGALRRTYRRSHGSISTTDYLVAATALDADVSLATLSTKHFPMFDELRPPFAAPH